MVDDLNPYQAPESPMAALEKLGRPPVYTAISILCSIIGLIGLLMSVLTVYYLFSIANQFSWRQILLTDHGQKVLIVVTLIWVVTTAYLAAARLLWVRRGRIGLILTVLAIGLTYLMAWLLTTR